MKFTIVYGVNRAGGELLQSRGFRLPTAHRAFSDTPGRTGTKWERPLPALSRAIWMLAVISSGGRVVGTCRPEHEALATSQQLEMIWRSLRIEEPLEIELVAVAAYQG